MSTWLQAIKNGHFLTFPRSDVNLINNHLTHSIATAKGHITQELQKLQSTKLKVAIKNLQTKQTTNNYLQAYNNTLLKIHKKFEKMKKVLNPGEKLEDKLTEDIKLDTFPLFDESFE